MTFGIWGVKLLVAAPCRAANSSFQKRLVTCLIQMDMSTLSYGINAISSFVTQSTTKIPKARLYHGQHWYGYIVSQPSCDLRQDSSLADLLVDQKHFSLSTSVPEDTSKDKITIETKQGVGEWQNLISTHNSLRKIPPKRWMIYMLIVPKLKIVWISQWSKNRYPRSRLLW